jgi:signal transduction histidine kinase
MKLLHKTTLWYVICILMVLLLTGGILSVVLQKEINDELDEQLMMEALTVKTAISQGEAPHSVRIWIDTLAQANIDHKGAFRDSLLFDPWQQKNEDYRVLAITDKVGDQYYRIHVMSSHIGAAKYYTTIGRTIFIAAIALAILAIIINYILSRNIWKPFFYNLKALQSFSVKDNNTLTLQGSDIKEFDALKTVMEDLTARSRQEYSSLHEFTENASHEIQTPLAIIRTKLDRLSQMAIDEQMAQQIELARHAAERLSRINKNLLLLTKIENNLFEPMGQVAISSIMSEQTAQMEELFALRGITLFTDIHTSVSVHANAYLTEILISNLLSNALQYTKDQGTVWVSLRSDGFQVTNEGDPLPFSPDALFKKFTKGYLDRGTGLGLAIVKQICQLHHWSVSHTFDAGIHKFVVRF